MKTYALVDEEVKQVTVLEDQSSDRMKAIKYYGIDGLEKRTYRVASEIFTNKAKAVKYFA